MFERGPGARNIVYDHRADFVVLELAAHGRGGNVVLLQIREHINIDKQPVGENYQTLDAAVEQHFEIAFEAAALIVHVREDREERRLVECVLDAAQHQRAVRVGHVEHHHADGVAAPAAQGAREQVGTVAEMRGRFLDASLGGVGNVSGQGSVVQDDGDGGR